MRVLRRYRIIHGFDDGEFTMKPGDEVIALQPELPADVGGAGWICLTKIGEERKELVVYTPEVVEVEDESAG